MIYTITFNPSLDYIISVDDMFLGGINRTKSETIFPGGKGINVSLVLQNFGVQSVALGFLAGFTGKEIEKRLSDLGIQSDFIWIQEGLSRINVKIASGEETEINGMGPVIDRAALENLYDKLDALVKGDILILAGSIPSSVPQSIYRDIMDHLQGRGIRIVVDATGKLLWNVLEFQPYLIKPNNHELGDLFGVTLQTRKEVIPYARKMQEAGAQNVLVSLAGEGAVLLDETGAVYEYEAPKGKVRNSVGAGDSMVAGFLTGMLLAEGREALGETKKMWILQGETKSMSHWTEKAKKQMEESPYEFALLLGLCAGSASAFGVGMATPDDVKELLLRYN